MIKPEQLLPTNTEIDFCIKFTVSGPIRRLLSCHRPILLIQAHARAEIWPVYSD